VYKMVTSLLTRMQDFKPMRRMTPPAAAIECAVVSPSGSTMMASDGTS